MASPTFDIIDSHSTNTIKHSVTIFASLLMSFAITVSSHAAEIAPDRSATYKSVNDIQLKMDVFEPAGLKASDHRPAIVYFFGGG